MRTEVTNVICKNGTMTAEVGPEQLVLEDVVDEAYLRVDVPVDRLPYSSHFVSILENVREACEPDIQPHELWEMLITRRKSGKLPRLRKGAPKIVEDLPALDKDGNVPEAVIDNDSPLRRQTFTIEDE